VGFLPIALFAISLMHMNSKTKKNIHVYMYNQTSHKIVSFHNAKLVILLGVYICIYISFESYRLYIGHESYLVIVWKGNKFGIALIYFRQGSLCFLQEWIFKPLGNWPKNECGITPRYRLVIYCFDSMYIYIVLIQNEKHIFY
jgi:hypothetical protein